MNKYYLPRSFSIPYQSIDDEHRQLIALLNRLAEGAELRAQQDVRLTATQFLEDMRTHFREEETLMRAVGYPRVEEHAAHHETSLKSMTGLLRDALDTGELQQNALDEVFSVLIDVVVKTDLYFEEFLIGIGQLPDKPKPD